MIGVGAVAALGAALFGSLSAVSFGGGVVTMVVVTVVLLLLAAVMVLPPVTTDRVVSLAAGVVLTCMAVPAVVVVTRSVARALAEF